MKIQHINKKINSHNIVGFPLQQSGIKENINFDSLWSSTDSRKLITQNKPSKTSAQFNCSIFFKCDNNSSTASRSNIEAGNICIIGTDKDAFNLSCHLISYFETRNYHLELVTPEQFLRACRSNDFNNQHYLIHIDPSCVSGNRIGVITDHCNTTFISNLKSLNIASSVISVINRIKYNRIIGNLGKNFSKRKAMLDSLKQNEFLVINNNDEKILCLKMEV